MSSSTTTPVVRTERGLRLSLADFRCIDQALAYVDNHYSKKISADALSMEVGLSKEKLQAGLQRRTGKTLRKHIEDVRLAKARELLANTNEPLKYVADAAGFVNESHFCKVFKKMHLISPVQYRYQQVV